MPMSNNVIGFINFISVLLSIPIIGAGIWLAIGTVNSCVKILQWPVIILGILILLVDLAGFIGGFWRITWLLVIYLIAMLVLIVLLALLVGFIYMVTIRGSGHPKSQSEFCGGESLGRTPGSRRRNLNVESARMVGKESSLKGVSKQVKMMKRGLSDIPEDLVAEILSRVPIISLGSIRSTCKQWNTLSRNRIFGKVAEANNLFFGFVLIDTTMYSLRIDHQGIRYDVDDLSFKQVSVLNQVNQLRVLEAYQCDGLLLFSFYDDMSRLLVWNPYLGQTRWIQYEWTVFSSYALGYDNNGNHKILQISNFGYSIYELSSNSWKVFDNWELPKIKQSVNLKGNTFFSAVEEEGYFLLSFDFTLESFGPRLSLPFHCSRDSMLGLSCVGDEKLAVLVQTLPGLRKGKRFEIWITQKIDCNEVVWTKWMHVEFCHKLFRAFWPGFDSFLVDEEKRVAVVFDRNGCDGKRSCRINCDEEYLYVKSRVFGEDGYCLHRYSFGNYEVPKLLSYVPSLVQIE